MRAQELWLPIDRMRNGAGGRLVAGVWSSAAKLLRLAAFLSRASAHTDTVGFVVANSEPNNMSSSDNLTHFGNSIYAITGQMDLTVCVASWHSGLTVANAEGGLALYIVPPGGDPSISTHFTVKAYGGGGVVRSVTSPFFRRYDVFDNGYTYNSTCNCMRCLLYTSPSPRDS